MRILFVLTYYRPHISGLTIYVERLARAMARRGHEVTVLTSHYRRDLPYTEMMDGMRVVRVPVLFRFGKVSVMPTFALYAWRLMRQHDVVSAHLPQAEGLMLPFMGRYLARKPMVLTYHCDLELPPGAFNRVIDRIVYAANYVAGLFASSIVAYTRDYAVHSAFLSRFMDKIEVIYPPIDMPPPDPAACAAFRRQYGAEGQRVVGFAGRFAEDKGVNYLLNAVPLVAERIPEVKFLLAGEYESVIGEKVYERLRPFIEQHRERVVLLGLLPNDQMGNFFGICEVLTVPSINRTESFGLVQIEAMLSGCPVVASNLPGVREPVRITGMGEIVPIRDSGALAEAIVKVIQNREAYVKPRGFIEERFSIERTLQEYEGLFQRLLGEVRPD